MHFPCLEVGQLRATALVGNSLSAFDYQTPVAKIADAGYTSNVYVGFCFTFAIRDFPSYMRFYGAST